MNRREFMRRMFGTAVTIAVPELWTPKTALGKLQEFNPSLYGIPYHQSDAFTGTWLGIERSSVPLFRSTVCKPTGRLSKETITAIQSLIRHIKENDNGWS